MPTSLLILHTHPVTHEESLTLSRLKKIDTVEIREIDLTQSEVDYKKITKAILDTDRIQVW